MICSRVVVGQDSKIWNECITYRISMTFYRIYDVMKYPQINKVHFQGKIKRTDVTLTRFATILHYNGRNPHKQSYFHN